LSSAVPTIERLGLAPLLEARGAVRTQIEAWTPYGGWIRFPPDVPDGYGVTRQTLDPMLRELAAGTPGVELMEGRTAVRLLGDDGRPAGVEVEGPDRAVRARLVVGADGRGSTVARLARVPGRVRPHNRFFYFAYWRGIRPRTTCARVWLLDPDGGAAFPNEDDLTVVAAAPHRSRLPEFRADREGAYERMVAALPDGPDIAHAERVSKLKGILDVRALDRYRRAFRRRLGLHHWLIADVSSGRKLTAPERFAVRATAADPLLARALEPVATRRRSPLRMLDPRLAPRLAGHLIEPRSIDTRGPAVEHR
jgi:2-polyprenyl-6-methoxyphenol hydroxylase-like FAD-dependent oxidoreductase